MGPAWVGVIVLSAVFGLGHVLQGWDAAIATGVLGACWAVIYLRRRSIVLPLVSHALFNSLEIVRMLVKSLGVLVALGSDSGSDSDRPKAGSREPRANQGARGNTTSARASSSFIHCSTASFCRAAPNRCAR